MSVTQQMVDETAADAADWGAKNERARIVAFGREYVERKAESAWSTAHLVNFLAAIERGEHEVLK
jgi:hypothetical protein